MDDLEYMKALREKVLSDCRSDRVFWTCHGRVLHNIYELASSIENMNDGVFLYHVNDDNEKNDFAKWINDVFEDGELAHHLKKVRDRHEYARIIRERIAKLEAIEH